MSFTVQSIVTAALKEWDHWGNSTWSVLQGQKAIGHTDDEYEFAQYVIDTYCSIGGGNPTHWAIQNDDYFWSAVGMSAFMAMGGFEKGQFPFAQSHSTFIRKFVAARKQNDSASPFGATVWEKLALLLKWGIWLLTRGEMELRLTRLQATTTERLPTQAIQTW